LPNFGHCVYYTSMLDPYRMVAINLFLSSVIFIGVLFFRFVFPKKPVSPFRLLLLLLMLPTISIFRKGVYESGDFMIHIYRSIEFYRSLSEGNLIPSWAGGLNATYGYPLFIFNYPLPYYLISFFHFLGFSFVSSTKLFLASNFILSGIFMFYFLKTYLKNELAAFAGSVFYAFLPYHLVALHFKNTIGEVLSFTVLPLIFWSTSRLINDRSISLTILTGFLFALLIASHVVIALFAGILHTVFILFSLREPTIHKLIRLSFMYLIAAGASAYIWFTPFILGKYTLQQITTIFPAHFPTLSELLYAPWRFGLLFQGPYGEISHLVGYMHLFILFAAFVILLQEKLKLKQQFHLLLFWTVTSVFFLFLITPYSQILWQLTPFIIYTGSHRLLILSGFCIAVVAAILANVYPKRKVLILLVVSVTILSTILNWGHRRMVQGITDSEIMQNIWKSTSEGEAHFYANTRWVDPKNPWFNKLPDNHAQITSGTGTIRQQSRNSTEHVYEVTAQTPLIVREHTLFFPGWHAMINGRELNIAPDNKGRIQFSLPKGSYTLSVFYTDISGYKLLKTISVITIIVVVVYLTAHMFQTKKRLPS